MFNSTPIYPRAINISSGTAFSPSSLISDPANSRILDFRDSSILFQDTLFTVPVTTPGQSVQGIKNGAFEAVYVSPAGNEPIWDGSSLEAPTPGNPCTFDSNFLRSLSTTTEATQVMLLSLSTVAGTTGNTFLSNNESRILHIGGGPHQGRAVLSDGVGAVANTQTYRNDGLLNSYAQRIRFTVDPARESDFFFNGQFLQNITRPGGAPALYELFIETGKLHYVAFFDTFPDNETMLDLHRYLIDGFI